ncbi:PAS and ANTAR domain-containing protein [Nocardia goodfellowii]|uniref:Xanthine dehydrogenase iron-sulfur cluster and FAD-binding subunit A n=1 Tax=Nocardia goodfellowii TaxID=882446 RepID=A0ABS4QRS3_9NOCA|nr:PAS and ANTAR domain-containing protein [Nocardia goodfellowii]MBP2194400.1 xanthine dehydrogenase iron-sulfur cluster and FAD-binding subunit A [Nocardia goodfellowii]
MTEIGQLDPDSAGVVERVIAGRPQNIGSFRFWFADQRWEWSEEVAALHGYEPGTVVPTTELLLSHKHPDDRAEVAHTLAAVTTTGDAFCSRHRIIDTRGEVHEVIVVGDHLLDEHGAVSGTTGYYIDVTETLQENSRATLDQTLPDLIEARAVIEQAKGILMLVYGVHPEQAFKVLQWRSQETNTKLRQVAEQLVGAIAGLGGAPVGFRSRFDHLLLTMHERSK